MMVSEWACIPDESIIFLLLPSTSAYTNDPPQNKIVWFQSDLLEVIAPQEMTGYSSYCIHTIYIKVWTHSCIYAPCNRMWGYIWSNSMYINWVNFKINYGDFKYVVCSRLLAVLTYYYYTINTMCDAIRERPDNVYTSVSALLVSYTKRYSNYFRQWNDIETQEQKIFLWESLHKQPENSISRFQLKGHNTVSERRRNSHKIGFWNKTEQNKTIITLFSTPFIHNVLLNSIMLYILTLQRWPGLANILPTIICENAFAIALVSCSVTFRDFFGWTHERKGNNNQKNVMCMNIFFNDFIRKSDLI